MLAGFGLCGWEIGEWLWDFGWVFGVGLGVACATPFLWLRWLLAGAKSFFHLVVVNFWGNWLHLVPLFCIGIWVLFGCIEVVHQLSYFCSHAPKRCTSLFSFSNRGITFTFLKVITQNQPEWVTTFTFLKVITQNQHERVTTIPISKVIPHPNDSHSKIYPQPPSPVLE